MARGRGGLPPSDDAKEHLPRPTPGGRRVGLDSEQGSLTPQAHENFSLSHRHSGLHGDGRRVKSASLDTVDPFTVELEPTYTPVNAATSGRKYRIQIIEVVDPETSEIQPVIRVVPAA